MEAVELTRLYERSQLAITTNVRGITDEESRLEPPGGGNSINWTLGHMLAMRGVVLRLAGGEPVWETATMAIYSGEEGVVFDPARALPLERLLMDLETTLQRLTAALSALSPAALAAPARNATVGEALAFLCYHEGYHAGQLGLLRRLLGHPGIIKQPKGLLA